MADATSTLNEISGALDGLATAVVAHIPDDRTLLEIWGWNLPAINRADFADYIRSPRDLFQTIDAKSVSDADLARLQQYPARIAIVQGQTLPNLPGGNAFHVYLTISSLIDALNRTIRPYAATPVDFAVLEDRKLLPASQIKSLKTMEAGIGRLKAESGNLETAVAEITAARAAAEALPAHMQSLDEARASYEAARKRIDLAGRELIQQQEKADDHFSKLVEIKDYAEAVLKRANAADSAATTVGLGKAFGDRAASLATSTAVLGAFLLVALAGAGFITYTRVEFVHKLMLMPGVSYNILWLNLTFTALSVSAPVWLAWLLTRQIGQRFRLAEDYGYKAAVAKAYEGYRAEAAQIDQELAKRLFSIALDRLSEAPLRLVEKDSPGSPAHEVGGPVARFLGLGSRRRKAADKPDPPSDDE